MNFISEIELLFKAIPMDTKSLENSKSLILNYYTVFIEQGLKKEKAIDLLRTYVRLILQQIKDPVKFKAYHEKQISPSDYFQFGLELFRPVVDSSQMILEGKEHLDKMMDQLKKGENVFFIGNHQTEPDPQFFSLVLEKDYPEIAENVVFIAGERVLVDPLAVPLSLGRNLLCIFSRKHMEFFPEEKAEKQRHNKRTMSLMADILSEGGKSIYVAASGGRDRVNLEGKVEVSNFDPQNIEMIYLMAKKAKVPTHFYPLTFVTHHLFPPPSTRSKELGEMRSITYGGLAVAFGKELDLALKDPSLNKHEWRYLRATAIHKEIKITHDRLLKLLGV